MIKAEYLSASSNTNTITYPIFPRIQRRNLPYNELPYPDRNLICALLPTAVPDPSTMCFGFTVAPGDTQTYSEKWQSPCSGHVNSQAACAARSEAVALHLKSHGSLAKWSEPKVLQ